MTNQLVEATEIPDGIKLNKQTEFFGFDLAGSVFTYQSCVFSGCVSPRDLDIIDKLRPGDTVVFQRKEKTHNQVRARVKALYTRGEDKDIAIRVGKTTVNAWRWR